MMKEKDEPGCFGKTFDQLLVANGLPNFSFGEVSFPSVSSILPQSSTDCVEEDPQNAELNESTQNSEEELTRVAEVEPVQSSSRSSAGGLLPTITIYKRKGSAALTVAELSKQQLIGNIIIRSSVDSSSPKECISKLSRLSDSDLLRYIVELPPQSFRKKLSEKGVLNGRPSTRASTISNK